MLIVDYIDFDKLSQEPDAGRVLGWVMAANDLAFTLYLQNHLKEIANNPDIERLFVKGAFLTVQRSMISLAAEAVAMASLCKESAFFKALISTHDEAERAFNRIARLTENPIAQDLKELADLLGRIRNKGTFHYYNKRDPHLAQWLQKAIQARARESSQPGVALIDQDDVFTRYTFADDVFDTVFLKHILQADTSNWEEENRRVATMLVDVSSDVRVIGDTIGKELLRRFPSDQETDLVAKP